MRSESVYLKDHSFDMITFWIGSMHKVQYLYNLRVQKTTFPYYRGKKVRSIWGTRPIRSVTDNCD